MNVERSVAKAIDDIHEKVHGIPYIPWAKRMADEFSFMQDLDGDGLAYGHDFVLVGLAYDRYPPVLIPIMHSISKRLEAGTFIGNTIHIINYFETLTDQRDIGAFERMLHIAKIPINEESFL